MSIWKRLFGGSDPKPNPTANPKPTPTPNSTPDSKSAANPKSSNIQPPGNAEPPPKLPFEFVTVAGREAFDRCMALRNEANGKFTPVILGSPKELGFIENNLSISNTPVTEILEFAPRINPEQFFADRKAAEPDYYEGIDVGEWPAQPELLTGITLDKDIRSGRYKESVIIAKIPTSNSFEVPAYLHMGGWNECPGAEEHVAILKHWHTLYGAEVIAVSGDVIECVVSRPPTTRDAAMKLAEEQVIYCADIVTQGVGTIANLGAGLLNSRFWYFWWD